MKKLIKVTQKDIKKVDINGYSTNTCPVARAINRAYKKKIAEVMGDGEIQLNRRGYTNDTYINNEKVEEFVDNFDKWCENQKAIAAGNEMGQYGDVQQPKPFQFYLEY